MNFEKMSPQEQAKEVAKLAKRANSRMRLQEQKDLKSQSYYSAKGYLSEELGRNYFYQGTKYDKEQLSNTYKELTNYLNDKNSTIRGLRETRKEQAKTYDKEYFQTTPKQEKVKEMQSLAKRANARLRTLEQKGYTKNAYEVATEYTQKARGSNRFYTGENWKNQHSLNASIQEVNRFLNSVTSTPSGYDKLYNRTIEAFRENGVDVQKRQEQEFFEFLSSDLFKKMSGYGDSGVFVETFVDAMNEGVTTEEIKKGFNEFLTTTKTIDYFQEKWNIEKYGKGILH